MGVIGLGDLGHIAVNLDVSFEDVVYQIKRENPTKAFAESYLNDAKSFYNKIDAFRKQEVSNA